MKTKPTRTPTKNPEPVVDATQRYIAWKGEAGADAYKLTAPSITVGTVIRYDTTDTNGNLPNDKATLCTTARRDLF